jgi:small subunit ribosomal protein S1
VTNAGAFIELEEGIDGFLHIDDYSWTQKVKNPSSVLHEGEEIDFIILESNPEERNVRLGIKQLSDDPWRSFAKAYKPGSIIEGIVSTTTDFGVFVKVPGEIEGLIKKQDLVSDRSESYDEALKKYKPEMSVKAVIIELNPDRQKLGLSVKDLIQQQQREEISRFIQEDEGEAGYTLGDLLKAKDDEND